MSRTLGFNRGKEMPGRGSSKCPATRAGRNTALRWLCGSDVKRPKAMRPHGDELPQHESLVCPAEELGLCSIGRGNYGGGLNGERMGLDLCFRKIILLRI